MHQNVTKNMQKWYFDNINASYLFYVYKINYQLAYFFLFHWSIKYLVLLTFTNIAKIDIC